ncbi:MAG TPA: nucleotidyltransferase family protein [Candidatus Acidoferrales bacterium]|nr:nucleotidyltransferase family protein [Candidatus Acidoferrales bacterium]
MQPSLAEKIRELAAGPIDWDYLLSEAAVNSITPLLASQLPAAAGAVAPGHLERLKQLTRANAMRCLVLTAELIKIIELFRSERIQAVPYKGPVLAAQAYGDVALREFEDLDIILRQRDMAKANEIVTSLGYRARFPWVLSAGAPASVVPGEYNYRDAERAISIELHTEVTLRHFPVPPDLDDLARRLTPVSLSGHDVWTFGAEDMLTLLCIHGSKDFWERISWVADIAEFVQSQSQLDWDQVFRRAEALHARRMLHLGLALAAGLLDAPLPDEVISRTRRDHVAAEVASEIEQRLLARNPRPLDAARIFRYRRQMVEGAFAGWRYALRLATVPAEEDWQAVRLSGPLAHLYVVLRPFRLLRKYGSAVRRAPHSS